MNVVRGAEPSITMLFSPSSDSNCCEISRTSCANRGLLFSLVISLLMHGFALRFLAPSDSRPGRVSSIPLQIHLAPPTVSRVEEGITAEKLQPALPAQRKEDAHAPAPLVVPTPQEVVAVLTPPTPQKHDHPAATQVTGQIRPLPEAAIANTREASGNRVFLRQVDLDVQMYVGADRRDAGTLMHQFRMLEKELYGVTVMPVPGDGEPDAPSTWRLRSSGSIRHQGLAPVMIDVLGKAGVDILMFDKAGSSSVNGAGYSARVQDGVLDRHSLLYQFMMQPPAAGGGEIWVTDGASYLPFRYKREGEDRFPLEGVGTVLAARFVFTPTAGGAPFELWLIPEMHYLPVKMRYQNAVGDSVELVVVKMRYE